MYICLREKYLFTYFTEGNYAVVCLTIYTFADIEKEVGGWIGHTFRHSYGLGIKGERKWRFGVDVMPFWWIGDFTYTSRILARLTCDVFLTLSEGHMMPSYIIWLNSVLIIRSLSVITVDERSADSNLVCNVFVWNDSLVMLENLSRSLQKSLLATVDGIRYIARQPNVSVTIHQTTEDHIF